MSPLPARQARLLSFDMVNSSFYGGSEVFVVVLFPIPSVPRIVSRIGTKVFRINIHTILPQEDVITWIIYIAVTLVLRQ